MVQNNGHKLPVQSQHSKNEKHMSSNLPGEPRLVIFVHMSCQRVRKTPAKKGKMSFIDTTSLCCSNKVASLRSKGT